ncbi:MAG: hypothetical protein INQ03_08445 [Candidatus Heimdallarchaeota archaeon]|nr:hypothetical protein [Candidatus Heimdallarchaeota archaeon]
MSHPLSYLLIITPAGLPLYAQSFQFDSDEACQSFNGSVSTEKDDNLIANYFTAMNIFVSEVIKDELQLIDLGFTKFKITGYIMNEVFFLGIFQDSYESMGEEFRKNFLVSVALRFFERYPSISEDMYFIDATKYDDFTNEILKLGNIKENTCRSCLTKCHEEDKNCLPHRFYYSQVKFTEESDSLRLELMIDED